ncbi:GNAT family protein [Tenacibaculum sp. 190524A02b]|uniref:GNAT family N-acetyltransferase n=1 Tax=Tenacibaculum vairaonense TaxID=3137860 RepID=UPI0031FAA7E5
MIILRKIQLEDIKEYRFWKNPTHKYHTLNGPYFQKLTEKEVEKEIDKIEEALQNNIAALSHKRMISNKENELIGEVSWYWKSEETNWLEIGIVVFNDKFWGKGIGYEALKKWIPIVFEEKPEIVRLGLTTWSGNHGMMKLAEKLGMKREATYRKARIVNGVYYDSVSYGILKEEWENQYL